MQQTINTMAPSGLAAPLQQALLHTRAPGGGDLLLDQLQHSVMQMLSLALERARRGDLPMPAPAQADTPRPVAALHLLSSREREVLQHIAAGDSNKHIARALDLSPHTVKRHVANILDKLGAQSRGQAAACWRAQG